MMGKLLQKRVEQIKAAHQGSITSLDDLTADMPPGWLFYLLGGHYGKMLTSTPSDAQLQREILGRRALHPLLMQLLPLFMPQRQVFESASSLMGAAQAKEAEKPSAHEPIIWIANHAFKDDVAATLRAAGRHAYILFGSLPQFYQTFDGLAAYLNGAVLLNRKVRASAHAAVARAVQVLKAGADLILFPEGVWNKSPNQLLLPFWPGVYRISQETGARVVPIVHYLPDMTQRTRAGEIHTLVDAPMRLDGLSQQAALMELRDRMATWHYLMMEQYGQATRAAIVAGFPSSQAAWEHALAARIRTTARYDLEIERCADYRPKAWIDPAQVWAQVAAIHDVTALNASPIACACQAVQAASQSDYQRRF